MTDELRNSEDDPEGASAPEPSLVARQAAARTGSGGDGLAPDTMSTDRVDARAATLGAEDADALGEETVTTDDLAGDPGPDPLKRT